VFDVQDMPNIRAEAIKPGYLLHRMSWHRTGLTAGEIQRGGKLFTTAQS
jgi:hypothetical protein